MKDEGIVQPGSKELEQLSRRLHQKVKPSRRNPGRLFPLGTIKLRAPHSALVRTLKRESAAYIAGLIEGEGTITLSRLHVNERRRLVVSIANTEIELLEFVLAEVGAGKITRKRTTSDRHTQSYCYAITSRQALALLRQTFPWLKSYKRNRAELALRDYQALTPRNGKYSSEAAAKRMAFETRFLAFVLEASHHQRQS